MSLTNGTETTVNGLFHNFRFESNFWCILLITVADAMTPNPLTDLETNRRAPVFSLRCADPLISVFELLSNLVTPNKNPKVYATLPFLDFPFIKNTQK